MVISLAIIVIVVVAMVIANLHALDSRCEAACAPMIGNDNGECMCATETGWRPMLEILEVRND